MKTTINQKEYEFEVSPTEPAVELIRERVGLTGTKQVCGVGVCGACTVLVDGNPHCSCLLPANRLEGKSVTTVEGHTNGDLDRLHPVQKALMAYDGLQCGYCTPGFVNAGIAFFETWRKTQGKSRPSRETIAAALAGNLCRCGAYQGIYNALQAACAGEFDDVPTAQVKFHRVEAIEKVTGRAKYTTDHVMEGMVVGKVLRSIHPFAKVRSLDFSEAQKLDGVFAVIDVLQDKDRTVRWVGTPIAMIAAADAQTAEAGLALIKVDYEVYKAVTSFDDSIAATNANAEMSFRDVKGGLPVPSKWSGNSRSYRLSLTSNRGFRANRQIRRARGSSDADLIDNRFESGGHAHTPLEPHSVLAGWNGKHLTLYASTQSINQVKDEILKKYDLSPNQLTFICDHVGGGFGAKGHYPEIILTIDLAKAAGKPVRVILDRSEVIAYSGHREETKLNIGLLSNQQGDFRAMQMEVFNNGGHAIEGNAAAIAATFYEGWPQAVNDHAVLTHQPPAKAFRGPGGINAAFALESTVDDVAHKYGLDPLALRRKWDNHSHDQQLFDYLEEVPAWQARDKVAADKGRYKRGVGLALGHWLHLYMPKAEVRVTASRDGLSVESGIQDIGQGSRTVLGTALAEAFGLDVTDPLIQIKTGRPVDLASPATGGSRVSSSIYPTAQDAARQVQAEIGSKVAQLKGLENVKTGPEGIAHSGGIVSWKEALAALNGETIQAKATRGWDSKRAGLPGMLDLDGTGLHIGAAPSTSAMITEVEVDTRLGKVRVLRTWSAIAAGRIFVPETARSQVYGGIVMGIGYTLYEERQIDTKSGQVLTYSLEDCRLPGIGDIPEMEVVFMEDGFDFVPGGGVGIGEVTMVPVAGSIANAVFHATGWRPRQVPIRPEHIVAAFN